jgi:hypothetical protein
MASLFWLIVWFVQGTPNLEWFGSWNDWAVALLGCIIFDVFSGREAAAPAAQVAASQRGEWTEVARSQPRALSPSTTKFIPILYSIARRFR